MPATRTYPQERQIAPDFTLQSSAGVEYQISRLRGRRNLVLLFASNTEGAMTNLLHALGSRMRELEEEEATVFVIFRGNLSRGEALQTRAGFPFPVLLDRDGSVHDLYGGPAVYLTDRYSEIYGAYRESLPTADEILSSLRHINAACPE